MIHLARSGCVATVALLVLGGCARDRSSAGNRSESLQTSPEAPPLPGPATTVAPPPPPPGVPTLASAQALPPIRADLDVSNLDDAGLAAVIQSIHLRLAQEAQVAETTATLHDVEQLAHEMDVLHLDVVNTNQGLFQNMGILPRASSVSRQIDADAERAIHELRDLHGQQVDAEYLDEQGLALRESLQLYGRMLQVAKSEDLRTELTRGQSELTDDLRTVNHLARVTGPGVTNQQGPSPIPWSKPMPPR